MRLSIARLRSFQHFREHPSVVLIRWRFVNLRMRGGFLVVSG